MSTVCSLFSCRPITSNFPSVPIVFHRFFSQITPSDVDLCFSLILVTTVTAIEEGTKSIHYVVSPTGDLHVVEWIFLCRKVVLLNTAFCVLASPISLSPLSLLFLWRPYFPNTAFSWFSLGIKITSSISTLFFGHFIIMVSRS